MVAVLYLILAFQVVPRALLQKELRFKLLTSIETIKFFCQALSTVTLALLHFRYWSLVLGWIVSALVGVILTSYWKRERFALPHVGDLSEA